MKHALLILTGLSIAPADICQAADTSWAVGRWIGYIQGWGRDQPNRRDIGARVLAISIAAPNAMPSAIWSFPAGTPTAVSLAINEEGLSLEHSGATVDLHRDGTAKLSGTYVGPQGRTFPITLTRPSTITAYDGAWSGTATPNESKCIPGSLYLSITGGEIAGTVRYTSPNPGAHEIEHISDVSGEVWADKIAFLRLKGRASHGRNSWFHGLIDDDKIQADDLAYSEGDCTFAVTLKRAMP